VSRSEEIGRSFYAELGAQGLANRTRPEWDAKIVAALREMLPNEGRALDLGCGYGRITLPLARAGYDVEGIDLSETLIAAAQRAGESEGLRVSFTVGSMRRMPYPPETFDSVICLWSASTNSWRRKSRKEALSEMWRVLRMGGFGLIEAPRYEEASEEEIEIGARGGPEHWIA
jgi:ubiquinone/menaquinone biosynthesis C-methylase UbiE